MNYNEDDTCQIKYVNQELVTALLKSQHDNKIVSGLAEIFGVLADPTRLKICMFLSESELCVCDLAAMLEHLRIGSVTPVATPTVSADRKIPSRRQNGILHARR